MGNKITSSDIKSLLLKKYDLDASKVRRGMTHRHAMFFELNNGTGNYGGCNFLDAFLIDLWPSGMFTRRAFEIKVSRADLLSELNNPDKRKWGMDISNEFWFVCTHDICTKNEIPESCGLMVTTKRGDKLRVVKNPTYRDARDFSRVEVMAIARKSSPYKRNADIKWLYQGSELTESALDELIESRINDKVNAVIAEGISQGVKDSIENIESGLSVYCDRMRDAGIKPPQWMERDVYNNFANRGTSDWEADRWIKDNITDSPSVSEMKSVKNGLSLIKEQMERMISGIDNTLSGEEKCE